MNGHTGKGKARSGAGANGALSLPRPPRLAGPGSSCVALRLTPWYTKGATYIDLGNLAVGEFTATGEMHAGRNNWLVAKKEVPYELWNRLRGKERSERME